MTPRQTITDAIAAYRLAVGEKDVDARARLADHVQTLAMFAAVQCAALGLAVTFAALAACNVPQALGRIVAAACSDGWASASYVSGAGDSVGAALGWGLLAWAFAKAYRAACHHADVARGQT